ncbi:hypothetical protein [Amycolatopsis jejuensis]|uniref:hypothetical protein n=1 Tax=Amycolatopsis jejuensis TaxID=330084 RepID=UPI0012E08C2B|nr:hypothetical protein [Amycolatopsis jejuensis]
MSVRARLGIRPPCWYVALPKLGVPREETPRQPTSVEWYEGRPPRDLFLRGQPRDTRRARVLLQLARARRRRWVHVG